MQAYALTDVGRIRTHNQDYLYSSSEPVGDLKNLFLVADGMGGHLAGDYASRFAVETLVSYLKKISQGQIIPELKQGLEKINEELYAKSLGDAAYRGMGTTLVAATIEDNILYVANIGDSRLYLYRNGSLIQITRDHSYVEELVAWGQLERGSHDYLEKKNIITRAVGAESRVMADFFEESLQPGDFILLCSDGLSNMVPESEICQCLGQQQSLREKVEMLINMANGNGGRDNIAAILVDPEVSEVKPC